jgi:hypothetical protein
MIDERSLIPPSEDPEHDGILSADEFRHLLLKGEHTNDDVWKLLISHAALINKVKWLEAGR